MANPVHLKLALAVYGIRLGEELAKERIFSAPASARDFASRDIELLLRKMTEMGASDLHLRPARNPLVRLHGRLQPLDGDPLKPAEIGSMGLDAHA